MYLYLILIDLNLDTTVVILNTKSVTYVRV